MTRLCDWIQRSTNKGGLFWAGVLYLFDRCPMFLGLLLLDVVMALIPYGISMTFGRLIDSIRGNAPLHVLLWNSAWMILIRAALSICTTYRGYLKLQIHKRVSNDIRTKLLSVIQRDEPISFEDESELYRFRRMDRIAPALSDEISALGRLINLGTMIISYLVYLWKVSPDVALLGVLPWIPALVEATVFSHIRYNMGVKVYRKQERHADVSFMFFDPRIDKEVRLFRAYPYVIKRWKHLLRDIFHDRMRTERRLFSRETLVILLNLAAQSALLARVGMLVVAGSVSIGTLVALIPFTATVVQALAGVQATFHGVLYSHREWTDLHDFLFGRDSSYKRPCMSLISRSPVIELQDVSFSYPGSERYVLAHLSFSIHPGETIALVGVNGAGKSTLLKVISGIYKPSRGKVMYDGIDIRELDPGQLQSITSFVFQSPLHYPLSIDDNVSLHPVDKWRLRSALETVGLSYDELRHRGEILALGYTHGTELSGGQWQRVAIARALIRDASIYIFDEPTAALDPNGELEIFRIFRRFTEGKTVILSTHRLGIARQADRIIVLDNGEISAIGTHHELVRQGGIYAQLYQAQAAWYTEPDGRRND